MENGSKVHGELAFMFLLKRYFSSLETLFELEVHFGLHHTVLSRLGIYMIDRLYGEFSNLLTDNIDFFVPRFNLYNKSIKRRIEGDIPIGVDRVVSFTDANVLQVCRPHDNDNIQRCLYNGMNRVHALKLTWAT